MRFSALRLSWLWLLIECLVKAMIVAMIVILMLIARGMKSIIRTFGSRISIIDTIIIIVVKNVATIMIIKILQSIVCYDAHVTTTVTTTIINVISISLECHSIGVAKCAF